MQRCNKQLSRVLAHASICALQGPKRLVPPADLGFHLISIFGHSLGSDRSLGSHGL